MIKGSQASAHFSRVSKQTLEPEVRTIVKAPPGIRIRIVVRLEYPNELTMRAPKAVTPPLQI